MINEECEVLVWVWNTLRKRVLIRMCSLSLGLAVLGATVVDCWAVAYKDPSSCWRLALAPSACSAAWV